MSVAYRVKLYSPIWSLNLSRFNSAKKKRKKKLVPNEAHPTSKKSSYSRERLTAVLTKHGDQSVQDNFSLEGKTCLITFATRIRSRSKYNDKWVWCNYSSLASGQV